jgi:hypothetical protein
MNTNPESLVQVPPKRGWFDLRRQDLTPNPRVVLAVRGRLQRLRDRTSLEARGTSLSQVERRKASDSRQLGLDFPDVGTPLDDRDSTVGSDRAIRCVRCLTSSWPPPASSGRRRRSAFGHVNYPTGMDQESRQPVHLELSADEALVFFEFVSRFTDSDRLSIADQAEARALWNLCGRLEKQLSEPFSPRYSELLAEARGRLRDDESEAAGS